MFSIENLSIYFSYIKDFVSNYILDLNNLYDIYFIIPGLTCFIAYIIISKIQNLKNKKKFLRQRKLESLLQLETFDSKDYVVSEKVNLLIVEDKKNFNLNNILKNTILPKIFNQRNIERMIILLLSGGSFGGVIFILIVGKITILPPPALLVVLILFGMFLSGVVFDSYIQHSKDIFNKEFPDALDTFKRGLKAGLSTAKSIELVSIHTKDPVSKIFKKIYDKTLLGESLSHSLNNIAKKLNNEDFNFFVVAIKIQEQTGGNIISTLGNIASMIRKREEMRLKVNALSSETVTTGKVLVALPFLISAIVIYLNPNHMDPILNSQKGVEIIIITAIMFVLGAAIVFKLSRIRM